MADETQKLISEWFSVDDNSVDKKRSSYDIAYDAFEKYKKSVEGARHYIDRLNAFSGELLWTIVDIFHKKPPEMFLRTILDYAYDRKRGPEDATPFFCSAFEYIANELHSDRSLAFKGPPTNCTYLIEHFEKTKRQLEQKRNEPTRPTDPRLSRIIPGKIHFTPLSTLESLDPPKQPTPLPQNKTIVAESTVQAVVAASPPPSPRRSPTPTCDFDNDESFDVKPNIDELRESISDNTHRSTTSEAPSRTISSNPTSETSVQKSSSSSEISTRKRRASPPSQTQSKQTHQEDALNTEYGVEFLRMQNRNVALKKYFESVCIVDNDDMETKFIIPSSSFRYLAKHDVQFKLQSPPFTPLNEWRKAGTQNYHKAMDQYDACLRNMATSVPLDQRFSNILISDFIIAEKRIFFEYIGHFSIDYPFHWSTLIDALKTFPQRKIDIKSFAICIGLELCVRLEQFSTAEHELVDFFNSFFEFYHSTYFADRGYQVKDYTKSDSRLISVVPPSIVVTTVPLISSGSDFPYEYVKAINKRIRRIVSDLKTQFPVVLFDWAESTMDLQEFNPANYARRWQRFLVHLNEFKFFSQVMSVLDPKDRR